jgi:hypothetical protein
MSAVDKTQSLLHAIEAAEGECYGVENDGTLSKDRSAAIDAYFGKNTTPAPEGNSQVVSRDLFDTVEWITPSLVRIFSGSDEVVKFEPVGPDDVERADQETMYVNHVITQKNRWEQIFHDWAKDALLTKNAYCMGYWDDTKVVEYEVYSGQSDDAFAMLVNEDGVEVLEHTEEVDTEAAEQLMGAYQQAAQQAMMQGAMPPEPPPIPKLHDCKIRRTADNGKVCLKVLPPERCLVHQKTPDYMLDECDFFEYWEEVSISSLRQQGFDIADDIDADSRGSSDTEEDGARDKYGEERSHIDGWEPAMRKVRARMCWIRHDHDGDGIAELQYCLVVGKNILYREECNRIPVSSIVATPVPHRHVGISIADVVLDIQETKTAILRQGIDNLFHANNPRLFLTDKINLDDALVSRPGGVVRGESGTVFGQDIAPIVIPNIFPQAVQGLEYMDQVREGRTGTNRYFTGTDENSLNKTASGIAQLSSSAAQRVEQIARMISPSVEYLFGVVHELILKHGHKREVVRIRGEWVTVDPSNWRKRRDLKIAVGLGSGNKDALMGHLMQIYQAQVATMQLGMDITDQDKIYNTLAALTKAAGFPTEAMFWKKSDPNKQQPPDPEMLKLQVETQAKQAELQLKAQEAQTEIQFKQQDAQIELEKAKVELQIKLAELEIKRQELEIKAQAAQMDQQLQQQKTQHEMQRSEAELGLKDREIGMQHMHKEREFEHKVREGEESKRQGEDSTKKIAELIEGTRTVGIERVKDASGKLIGARRKLANGKTEEVPIA